MKSTLGIWELIKQKRFEEACQKADQDYKPGGSLLPLRNKVIALLNLKKYNEAFLLCQELLVLSNATTSSEFERAGVAKWLIGESSEAIEYWRKGLTAVYVDAAGGVIIPSLLYFAAVKMNNTDLRNEAIHYLKKRWKGRTNVNWLGAIAGYLLNEITEQKLQEFTSNEPTLHIREMTQAHFHMAVKHLEVGNTERYLDYMTHSAQSSYGYLENEYYLAIGEFEQLNFH